MTDGGAPLYDSEVTARILEMAEAGELIPMCAWCERLELDGGWVQPTQGALAVIDVRNSVSHTICPTCAAKQTKTP